MLIVAALGAWRFLPQRSDRDGSVQPASRPAAAPVQPAPAAVAAPPPRPPAAAVDPPPNPAQAGSVQPTSAPAAPVRATDAPRTGAGASYNVQVAAFRTAQRAAQVAQALEAAGLPVTTRSDAGTGWHQILVGPFPSPEAAEAAQRTLAREGFSDTHVAPVVR
jgi:DedD protein